MTRSARVVTTSTRRMVASRSKRKVQRPDAATDGRARARKEAQSGARREPQSGVRTQSRTSRLPSDRASANLTHALADHRLTNAEWARLAPDLRPQRPGGAAWHDLLAAYADRGVHFDDAVGIQAGLELRRHGYDVEFRVADRDGTTRVPDIDVAAVVAGNAGESDPVFAALLSAVGRSDASGHVAIVDGGFAAHPLLREHLSDPDARVANGRAIGARLGRFSRSEREEGAHHGTHVLGIATRGWPNLKASAYGIPLATLSDAVRGRAASESSQPLIRALQEAVASGANVVNVSIELFVTPSQLTGLRRLMERHPGVLFVFGAGNDARVLGEGLDGRKTLAESIRLKNCVVVGASDAQGERWPNSNVSEVWVDLAARGEAISSADSQGGFSVQSGTSMAAPQVTNLAAKLRALNPALTPEQLIRLMGATSDRKRTWRGAVGSGGSVNPERALVAAAALTLMASGSTLAAALERLKVPSPEGRLLTRLLRRNAWGMG